jgi:acyl carrier protein
MADALAPSRETIFENVRTVLEEALGVDADEITPQATITGDLEAESIDFLDIQFRLEKKFSTPTRPFKISQGELFPENLMENPTWVADGRFTDAGMAMLKQRLPHVDFASYDGDVNKVGELITVQSLVEFVHRKLQS